MRFTDRKAGGIVAKRKTAKKCKAKTKRAPGSAARTPARGSASETDREDPQTIEPPPAAPAPRAPKDPNSATNQYGLTPLQWRFLELYPLCDFNGKKAAIAAGYRGRNAAKWASTTLKKQHVREALQEMMSAEAQFYELSRARIIKAWMDRAFGSIKDLGDNPGDRFELKRIGKMTDEQAAQIESITQAINNKGEVVLGVKRNSTEALKMLTKIMGLAEPQTEPESKGAFVRWLDEQKRAEAQSSDDEDDA